MKKGVFLVSIIFLSFVFFSLVSAVTCSNPSQTIMKLYSATNAHGSLWNGGYTEDICYNTLFGVNYSLANIHNCASNLVLNLSSITNAHAEIPGSSSFSNPSSVCYGDLVCRNYTGTCPSGSVEAVRLSATTNAHLSKAGSNPGGMYNVLICCSSEFANAPASIIVHWRDMTGSSIDLKNVSVNNSVVLDAQNLPVGKFVSFEVFEKNAGSIRTFSNITDSNGRASIKWKITDSDMAGRARSDFYFNVSNSSLSIAARSASLYVNNSNTNVPPSCAIISPMIGSIHPIGENILLTTNPNANDPDSVVNINWKIVDADSAVEEGSIVDNATLSFVLGSSGTKIIKLNVTDDVGSSCYNEIGISVFNATLPSGQTSRTEVFAWINKPAENKAVQTSNLVVEYSANASYAYNISSSSCSPGGSLVCVAGRCPTTSVACGNNPGATISGSPQSYSSLNFNWLFDGVSYSGASGLGKNGGSRIYVGTGEKTIKVIVSYGSASDAKSVKFMLLTSCDRNPFGEAWVIDVDASGNLRRINTKTADGACVGATNSVSDDCCPNGGWVCASATSGQKLCQQPIVSAALCDDYLTQASCNADEQSVGNRDSYLYYSQDLYNSYNCSKTITSGGNSYLVVCGQANPLTKNGCVWKDNKCWLNVSLQRQDIYPPVNLAGCLYQSRLGECIGGYQNVTTIGEVAGSNGLPGFSCPSENYVVLCGRTGVKLPFFGITQFAVALIVIVIVYYLIKIGFFKKSKSKKRKR